MLWILKILFAEFQGFHYTWPWLGLAMAWPLVVPLWEAQGLQGPRVRLQGPAPLADIDIAKICRCSEHICPHRCMNINNRLID